MRRNKNIVVPVSSKLLFAITIFALLFVQFHVVLFTPVIVQHALECVSILVLLIVFWFNSYKNNSYKIVTFYIGFSLLCTLAYVVPLSGFDALSLPGRELYASVASWLSTEGLKVEHSSLSIIPERSVLAILAILPLLAMYYSAVSLPEKYIIWVVYFLLLTAGLQSLLGVVQYASGNESFYFGMTQNGRSATGLYINRDHFSALLVMILPMAIGLMLFSIGRVSKETINRSGGKEGTLNQILFFGFIAIFIFLAAIFTRSRAGVLLIMAAVLLSSVIFSRHIGGKQSVGLVAIFTTIGLGLAASIGLIPVLNRFVGANPVEDERWRIFANTIEGIKQFFPVGSGPGTFSDIYRVFQPIEQLRFINNAHNDYLELLFEMGAAGGLIIIGFILVYLFGLFKLSYGNWDKIHFIQVASAIGILLILLHASMDFIFHEPMNAMIFCFLSGVLLRKRTRRT